MYSSSSTAWSCCRTTFYGVVGAAFAATQSDYSPAWMIVGGFVGMIASSLTNANGNIQPSPSEYNPIMKSFFHKGKIVLDSNTWAVTLINTIDKPGGHAMIIVEGIIEKKPKRMGYDLAYRSLWGPNVYVFDFTHKHIKTEGYYHTWVIWAPCVKRMVSSIESEISNLTKFKFHILGNDSFIAQISNVFNMIIRRDMPQHNCMTWVAAKLEMLGIILKKDPRGLLMTLPTTYSEKRIVHPLEFPLRKAI